MDKSLIESILKIGLSLLSGDNIDKKRSYNRTEINKEFSKAKKEKHADYKKKGSISDGYTNKKLEFGGKWDYDHVVSSAKAFDYFKGKHTDKEIAKIINVSKNIVPTDRTINKSKGKYELHQVSERLTKYGADPKTMKTAESHAWKSMEKESEIITISTRPSIWRKIFG